MRLALTLTVLQDLSDPTSKNSAGAADVVTLGDAWLAQAIRDRLVQPIANAESYRCVCVCSFVLGEPACALPTRYPPASQAVVRAHTAYLRLQIMEVFQGYG